MKLNKKLLLILTPIVVIIFVGWFRQQNQLERCYKLPTDTAVKLCVLEYQEKNFMKNAPTPTPTISKAFLKDLNKIEVKKVQFYIENPNVGVPYLKVKGEITNNSDTDINNISIQVKAFNNSDNPDKVEPKSLGEFTIKQTVHKGKSMTFDETAIINPSGTRYTWELVSVEINDLQYQIKEKLQ